MESGQRLHGTCYVSMKTLDLAKNRLDWLQSSARVHHMLQLHQLQLLADFFNITSCIQICLQISQLHTSAA